MLFGDKLKQARLDRNMSQEEMANLLGTSKQVISRYETNQRSPKISMVAKWCHILNIDLNSMLDDGEDLQENSYGFPAPRITEGTVTFPVIGEVAAGFDRIAEEDWRGDTVDIPECELHGRPKSDFLVLTVRGNSMYPMYLDGDRVLVHKQPEIDRNGEVGLVRYGGENATLKRIEYNKDAAELRLIPINPEYPPRMISGPDIDQCEILGVPCMLIRNIPQKSMEGDVQTYRIAARNGADTITLTKAQYETMRNAAKAAREGKIKPPDDLF